MNNPSANDLRNDLRSADAFTLVEVSIASTATIILFGLVLSLSSFTSRDLDRRAMKMELAMTGHLIMSRLTLDLSHARSIEPPDITRERKAHRTIWTVRGQNGRSSTYDYSEMNLRRNGVQLNPAGMRGAHVNSFAITTRTIGAAELAEFHISLHDSSHSTISFEASSRAKLRGAPIWEVIDE